MQRLTSAVIVALCALASVTMAAGRYIQPPRGYVIIRYAYVGGLPIPVILDTGAGVSVFTAADLARITDKVFMYNKVVNLADYTQRQFATYRIPRITFLGCTLQDVLVYEGPPQVTLRTLGKQALDQLTEYTIRNGVLSHYQC